MRCRSSVAGGVARLAAYLAILAAGCGGGALVEEGPPPFARPAGEASTPRDARAIKLHEPVSANFVGADLDWVLSALLTPRGIRYSIRGAALEDTPDVTLHFDPIPLDAMLRWACRGAGCSYAPAGDDLVVFPDGGTRISAPPSDDAAKAWLAETERALTQKVSMNFVGADLGYLLATLFKISGVNYVLDRDAASAGGITIKVDGVPLREVLDSICRDAGLEFAPVDYAVFVGPREAIAQVTGRGP